jgi:hypothetical protein
MRDVDLLADFFMVDHVAQRLGWILVPDLCAEAVRELQTLAADSDTYPDLVMQAIRKLEIAIGPTNVVAVIAHDLWSDWCPQPADVDPSALNNEYGVVVWAGKRGYVKCSETGDGDDVSLNLHSVRT